MELQDNICDKYIKTKIFRITHVTQDKEKNYIFIGGIQKDTQPILKLIENNQKLNKEQKEILNNYYGDISKFIKPNTKFIYSFIKKDDSIITIKKKILTYLSDPDTNSYFNINNQLLYIKQSNINSNNLFEIKNRLEDNFPNINFSKLRDELDPILSLDINCSNDIKSLIKQKESNSRISEKKINTKKTECQNLSMNKNYDKLKINNRLINLGFSYQNNLGRKIHIVSPYYSSSNTLLINSDVNDLYIDENSKLISSYGDIDDDTIYLIDYKITSDELGEENMNSRLLFPQKDDYSEAESKSEFNLYNPIIKDYDNIINDFESIYFKYRLSKINFNNPELKINEIYENLPETIYDFNKCTITNAVFYINYGSNLNLDLSELFEQINVNKSVPFVRYKNIIDNIYKIHLDSIYNKIKTKTVTSNFKNSSKYIVNYEPFYFNTDINIKLLEKWKINNVSLRERQFIKNENDLNRDYLNKHNSIKIVYLSPYSNHLSQQSKYNDLIINDNGYLEIKLSFNQDENISEKFLDNNINYIHKICSAAGIKNINTSIDKKSIDNILLNSYGEIYLPKIKLSLIEKKCNELTPFVYQISSENKNIIKLKWIRTDNLESYESIKNYFIKLKKSLTGKSISEFNDIWINETKKIFKLPELEATTLLSSFTETIAIEDFKRLPPEMETDITIEKTNQFNNENLELYKVIIKNGNNINENVEIYKFLKVLFFNCYNKTKPTTVSQPKVESVKILSFAKKNFVNDDALDFEDDLFSDEDESENSEEELEEEETVVEPIVEEESYSSDESGTSTSISYRNYFRLNRTKDLELFFFPTDSGFYSPYSIKCGAVDKRQPLLLTKNEIVNLEKINPDGYKLIEPVIDNYKKEGDSMKVSKMEWGSSSKKKNYFICPRIWCTKCKLVLTPDQLFESVSHKYPDKYPDNEGRCPFCNGRIIEGQIIQNDETIFIRKAHDYWADPNTKDPSKKTSLWKKYLKGAEKEAYTSFLDPKLHPKGLCMPCCNSNPLGNYKKCMIIDVDISTQSSKINIKDFLKPKNKIDGYTLKQNDLVLVKNQKNVNSSKENGIYKITKGLPEKIEKFTNLDLNIQSGMVIVVKNGNIGKDKQWEIRINDKNELKAVLITNIVEDKYVLGSDKFPLGDSKLGLLPETIDKLLLNNSDSYVQKGKPKIGSNLFFRRGINQDNVNSFISCIASIYGADLEDFVSLIITNITPEIFISLNSGNLINQFYKEVINLENINIFNNWCKVYKDFVQKLNKKFKFTLSNEELLDQITSNSNIKRIYRIFISFESYKKYIGNLNLYKDPQFLLNLFSKKIDWLFSEGLNIIIIERLVDEETEIINIECPNNSNIEEYINFNKPFTLILKQNNLYESLVFTKVKSTKMTSYSILNQDLEIKSDQFKIIESLGNLVIYNCKEKIDELTTNKYLDIDYNLLPSINYIREQLYDDKTFIIDSQISDSFGRGIGVILNNKTTILCKPYGIDTSFKIEYIENIELLSFDIIFKQLNEIDSKYPNFFSKPNKIVLDEKKEVIGIILNSGNIHLTINEKYSKSKHKLETIDINNYISLDKNLIQDINDMKSEYMDQIVNNRRLYNNLKNELINFFKIKNKNIDLIKEYISDFVNNRIIDLNFKRQYVGEIISNIINFLIIFSPKSNLDDTELCSSKTNKKCNLSNKCSIGSDILKLDLNGEEIIIRSKKCKLLISKVDKELFKKYLNLLIEEIIRYPHKNKEILNENKKLYANTDKNSLILTDSNFSSYIENIFKINNIYLNEPNTYTNTDPNNQYEIKNIKESDIDTTVKPKPKPKKLLIEDNKVSYPIIIASKTALDGITETGDKWKEGQCIFPWNVTKNKKTFKNLDKCIMSDNIDKGSYCATSIYPDNHPRARIGKTFGYCPKGSPSITAVKTKLNLSMPDAPKVSDIKAINSPYDGKTISVPDIKEGYCIFPFKNKGKWVKECIPSKNKTWRKWCATSLHNSGPHKNKAKTWGYCLEDESPQPDDNTPLKIKKSFKLKTVKKSNNTTNSSEKSLNKSKKIIYTTKYDKRNKSHNGKSIKTGECIFPFSHKKKLYNECITTTKELGSWCATEVNSNNAVVKWAYCLPEGIKSYKDLTSTSRNSNDPSKETEILDDNQWIKGYFKDDKFNIEKTENYNQSLFNSLSKTVTKLSDKELRSMISEELTPEIFEKLKEAHHNFYLKSNDKGLKSEEQKFYEHLYLEFDFLEGIDNYSDLQRYIKTPSFTYNLWSILTFEKLLKFKALIIHKDENQAAYCGPDLSNVDNSKIKVDNYIILFWDSPSFDLVTYNGKNMFTKDQLPKSIQKEFNKCSKHPNFIKITD